MTIQWGGFNGHLRVGIEVATTAYNTYTPSIDVHVRTFVQCDSTWNFADNQTVPLSGSVGATYNFYNGLGPNGIIQVGTYVIANQGQFYGGGPDYSFTARLSGAYNGAAPSVTVGYRLPARPTRPPAPPSSNPAFSSITATSVFVSWGGTSDAGGLSPDADELQVSANSGFTALVHDSVQGGSSRSVTGLAPNTTYWARSRIHNAEGWSGWSGVTAFTTSSFATGAPSVTGVAADAATVNWVAPTGGTPTRYEVQYARDSAFSVGNQLISSTTWDTSRRISGLIPGAGYYVRVRSGTSTGFGPWSSATAFTTSSFLTQSPTITDLGPDAATANWVAPTGASPTGFELQWARDSAFTAGVQTVTSTTWRTSQRMTSLAPATKYWVRIRSNTSTGYGSWSKATLFETLSGAKIRMGGAWVDAPVWVRSGGQWKVAKVWKRVNGNWVL